MNQVTTLHITFALRRDDNRERILRPNDNRNVGLITSSCVGHSERNIPQSYAFRELFAIYVEDLQSLVAVVKHKRSFLNLGLSAHLELFVGIPMRREEDILASFPSMIWKHLVNDSPCLHRRAHEALDPSGDSHLVDLPILERLGGNEHSLVHTDLNSSESFCASSDQRRAELPINSAFGALGSVETQLKGNGNLIDSSSCESPVSEHVSTSRIGGVTDKGNLVPRRPRSMMLSSSWSKLLVVAVAWVLAWSSFIVRAQGQGMGQVPPLPAVEMEALQDLYEATSGPDWVIFGVPWNFTGVHNPCEEGWEGVECTCQGSNMTEALPYTQYAPDDAYYYDDSTGVLGAPCNVSKLSLGFTKLQGTLPTSLGHLVFLTRLHMEHNHINGSIPSSIAALTDLEVLSLGVNLLTASIPTSLGYLTAMRLLLLYNNSLTGPIPTSLGYLTNMTGLALSLNSLNGAIPTSLGFLTNMTGLALSLNSLNGAIPTSLGFLTTMQILYLDDNSLTGSIPTSLGYLTAMSRLDLSSNSLNGSIPISLGYLTSMQTLYLDYNSLTSSIPTLLGYLEQMQYLSLAGNFLNGTIPTSFVHLTALNTLDLYWNSLDGSIPTLRNLTKLQDLILWGNLFEGTIPTWLGCLTTMEFLSLGINSLEGTIPTALGYLTGMKILELNTLSLDGSIPSTLGYLTGLQSLSLSDSKLTGSIPTSFGYLTAMEYLSLYSNSLEGSIPTSLGNFANLLVLQLFSNSLTGNIVDFIKPGLQSLQTIDLSMNQFTGSLPTALFQLPHLTSVAMVQNCFSGTLPSEMCSATSLQALDLGGLHTALSCQDPFFPLTTIKTYKLTRRRSMGGSIPSCVFSMPNLTTLHLPGNAFTGTIGGAGNLILNDLNLAHNILNGSIPQWIQGRPWASLDLGYNRLKGTLVGSPSGNLSLNVNRLSGNIPLSLVHAQTINILGGNMFDCNESKRRTQLPQNDPNHESYQCGSDFVDYALNAWAVVMCIWLMGLLLNSKFGPRVHQANDSLWCRILSTLNGVTDSFFAFAKRGLGIEDLTSRAPSSFHLIKVIALAVACGCVVVLLPSYGTLSLYYRTHSLVYTWAVSSSHLAGSTAAGVVIGVWAIIGVMMYWGVTKAIDSKSRPKAERATTAESVQLVEHRHSNRLLEVTLLVSFVVVNLIVMGGANFGYVFLITMQRKKLEQVKAPALVAVQVALAVIKVGWNSFVLPLSFKHIMERRWVDTDGKKCPHGGAKPQFVLNSLTVLNNILLPCIVEGLVDPNCFFNVIADAPTINFSYPYTVCTAYDASESCASYSTYQETGSFSPPFIYNYQCTSALLTNYAPVFVFTQIFGTFVVPILLLLWSLWRGEKFHPSGFTRSLVSLFAIAVTFGVAFPLLLLLLLVAVFVVTAFAEAQMKKFVTLVESEAESRESEAEARESEAGPRESEARESEAGPRESEAGPRESEAEARESEDEGREVARVDAVVMEGLVSSLWLLVPLSASFNAFFVFDILGDEVGWEWALGGLFAVIALPMLVWGGHKIWCRCRASEGMCVRGDGVGAAVLTEQDQDEQQGQGQGQGYLDTVQYDSGDVEMVDAFNESFRTTDHDFATSHAGGVSNPMVTMYDPDPVTIVSHSGVDTGTQELTGADTGLLPRMRAIL